MEEQETIADDIEWDNLENEDALTGIGSSLLALGPFPSHGGEGMSREPTKAGHTIGLPQESTEAGGSTVAPKVLAEVGGTTVTPQEPRGASPSAQEQGAGLKQIRSDETEQRSGGSPPKRVCHPTVLR